MLVFTAMSVVAYQSGQRAVAACLSLDRTTVLQQCQGGVIEDRLAFRDQSLDLAILSAALLGACIGFLWYNAFPADVFMGDTGSLALGGAVAAFAVFTKTELLLPLIGGVFVVEALSVIIQVVSFKRSGRRVFLMAPIHHHFEMQAWSRDEDHRPLLDHRGDLRGRGLRPVLPAVRPVQLTGGGGPPGAKHARWPPTAPSMLRACSSSARRAPGIAAAAALAGARRGGRAARPVAPAAGGDAGGRRRSALGERGSGALVAGADVLVKSPGVPAASPVVAAARAAGVPVWSEVELGFRLLPDGRPPGRRHRHERQDDRHELTGAMLAAAGAGAVVAGNVGVALTGSRPAARRARSSSASCRRSSSRTSSTLRAPRPALLNVTPGPPRPARHAGGVRRCKLRMFERQQAGRRRGPRRRRPVGRGARGRLPGDGRRGAGARPPTPTGAGLRRGTAARRPQPRERAVAAALARALGADDEAVPRRVRGLPRRSPHRLERVGELRGVAYVERLEGDERGRDAEGADGVLDGASGSSSAARDKGADFAPLAAGLAGRVRART